VMPALPPRTSREDYVAADGAELWYREIGDGPPIFIVHGGPDFNHAYLLPDMDQLADAYRLVYYDQRGRFNSRGGVRLDDLGIDRYTDDLYALRAHLGLPTVAVLGHSWDGHVAMHYAVRHPDRVSRLILMNSAPACNDDWLATRDEKNTADGADRRAARCARRDRGVRRRRSPHRDRILPALLPRDVVQQSRSRAPPQSDVQVERRRAARPRDRESLSRRVVLVEGLYARPRAREARHPNARHSRRCGFLPALLR
jgi:pimeloyl-ACP methyl ester carboxylesterase